MRSCWTRATPSPLHTAVPSHPRLAASVAIATAHPASTVEPSKVASAQTPLTSIPPSSQPQFDTDGEPVVVSEVAAVEVGVVAPQNLISIKPAMSGCPGVGEEPSYRINLAVVEGSFVQLSGAVPVRPIKRRTRQDALHCVLGDALGTGAALDAPLGNGADEFGNPAITPWVGVDQPEGRARPLAQFRDTKADHVEDRPVTLSSSLPAKWNRGVGLCDDVRQPRLSSD